MIKLKEDSVIPLTDSSIQSLSDSIVDLAQECHSISVSLHELLMLAKSDTVDEMDADAVYSCIDNAKEYISQAREQIHKLKGNGYFF